MATEPKANKTDSLVKLEPRLPQFSHINDYVPLDAFRRIVEEAVDRDWVFSRNGPWMQVVPAHYDLPRGGWKLHVSATPHNAEAVLRAALRVVVPERVGFKVLLDPQVLTWSLSRLWDRAAVGKFITVYPLDVDHFHHVGQALGAELEHFSGPYILSDRPYPKSGCLYYRYGAIAASASADGGVPLIEDAGGQLVPDMRSPWYQQPPWVTDPFGIGPPLAAHQVQSVVLRDRFTIDSPIKQTGARSVYLGKDAETSQSVVVKEARGLTDWTADGTNDAVASLRREKAILSDLNGCSATSNFVDYFESDSNGYLVESFEDGAPLHTLAASFDNPLIVPGALVNLTQTSDYILFINEVWAALERGIAEIHSQGWAVGDVNSRNILVTESAECKFIDLEGAFKPSHREVGILYEPGYGSQRHARSGASSFADDYYGLAACALDLIFPVNRLSVLSELTWRGVLSLAEERLGLEPGPVSQLLNIHARRDMDSDAATRVKEVLRQGIRRREVPQSPTQQKELASTTPEVVERLANGLVAHLRPNHDPVAPVDRAGFGPRSRGLGYGASGVLLGLRAAGFDSKARDLAASIYASFEPSRPLGLFDGAAGISWTLLSGPSPHQAEPWLAMLAEKSTNVNNNATIFSGLSGFLLALLNAEILTSECKYGVLAERCTQDLISLVSGLGPYEPLPGASESGLTNPTGLLYGRTGVALALLEAGHRFNHESAVTTASDLLNQEFEFLHQPRRDVTVLALNGSRSNPVSYSQYWGSGGGLACVLARGHFLDSPLIGKLSHDPLDSIISSMAISISASPGWGMGMAGISNCLINLAYYLPERHASLAQSAAQLMDNARAFFVLGEQDQDVLFVPSTNDSSVISGDFLTGSSGVMVALEETRKATSSFRLEPGCRWIA